jgi:hypothetical protein
MFIKSGAILRKKNQGTLISTHLWSPDEQKKTSKTNLEKPRGIAIDNNQNHSYCSWSVTKSDIEVHVGKLVCEWFWIIWSSSIIDW